MLEQFLMFEHYFNTYHWQECSTLTPDLHVLIIQYARLSPLSKSPDHLVDAGDVDNFVPYHFRTPNKTLNTV